MTLGFRFILADFGETKPDLGHMQEQGARLLLVGGLRHFKAFSREAPVVFGRSLHSGQPSRPSYSGGKTQTGRVCSAGRFRYRHKVLSPPALRKSCRSAARGPPAERNIWPPRPSSGAVGVRPNIGNPGSRAHAPRSRRTAWRARKSPHRDGGHRKSEPAAAAVRLMSRSAMQTPATV